jgi:hypothetical protein
MRYSLISNGVYCALTIYFICGQIQSLGVPKIGGFQFIQNHPNLVVLLNGETNAQEGSRLVPYQKVWEFDSGNYEILCLNH